MKNFNYPVTLMLLMLISFSCSDDLNETLETVQDPEISAESSSTTLVSLGEIDDQALKGQLPEAEKHIKAIINSDYDHLLAEHDLKGMFLDTDNVVIASNSDKISYTLLAVIPHSNDDASLNQYAYLTLTFRDGVNTDNQLIFGYQMDYSVSFDENGSILNTNNPQAEYYTPKPKGLPSKAPKSV